MSDALPSTSVPEGSVLALETTFLDPDDRTAEALWNLNRAEDWAGFRAALENFSAPQQNIVYADTTGTIGFIAPARIPLRRSGEGWMPVPGWTGEHDWVGTVPFGGLPQGTDPASGHFASANNKIVPDRYRYFLSRDWDLPNRAQRIEELLAATPRQSPGASAAMQADTLSIMARRLVPLMTRITPKAEPARTAVARLRQWDFRMDADKIEPLLFTAWLRTFAHSVLFARLGDAAADYWDLRPAVMEAILRERPDWCAEPKQPDATTCEGRLLATLDTAVDELRRDYGTDLTTWQWGRAHIARFPNPVFDRIDKIRDWLRVATPTSGGYDTLNRGATNIRDDAHPYEQIFGAGLRIITDMADPAGSRIIATPGQSGNPMSRHFADLLGRWHDFGWLTPGHAASSATLTLVRTH